MPVFSVSVSVSVCVELIFLPTLLACSLVYLHDASLDSDGIV